MSERRRIDVRSDQLKILKLENRFLKPMAETLVNDRVRKSAKTAAVAAAILALSTQLNAPREYIAKINAPSEIAEISAAAFSEACDRCGKILAMVDAEASASAIIAELEKVFVIVQIEHERLENLAEKANARLIPTTGPNAIGDGSKRPPAQWLSQLLTRAL